MDCAALITALATLLGAIKGLFKPEHDKPSAPAPSATPTATVTQTFSGPVEAAAGTVHELKLVDRRGHSPEHQEGK